MKFYKYTGLGNDFVFVDGKEAQQLLSAKEPLNIAEVARRICHRRFGVGADGLVLLLPSEKADVQMRIWNADGSEAEMCGNASRCVALHWKTQGFTNQPQVVLDTLAGLIYTEMIDATAGLVRVNMGCPRLKRAQIPMTGAPEDAAVAFALEAAGQKFTGTAVSMGNPHVVIFVEDISQVPLEVWGPQLEKHPFFPQKTNVEFVQVLDAHTVRMRVWERGAGVTMACGTGACATAVAAVLNKKTEPEVTVKLDGGNLQIAWPKREQIFMTGPARLVYTGEWPEMKL